MSVPNVIQRFCIFAAPFLPHRTFNGKSQSKEFGLTLLGACIFSGNVVLEALRVVTVGFFKPVALATGQ